MLEELPKEVREFLKQLGEKAHVVKVEKDEDDESPFAKVGQLLGSMEGLKYILADEAPGHVYEMWLRISTHYTATCGMVAREILQGKSHDDSLKMVKGLHKRMKNFFEHLEKEYKGKAKRK